MRKIPQNSNPDRAGRDGLARRDVLRAAPLLGLGVFLPGAASAATGSGKAQGSASSRHDPVYRQSEQIRRYYERARF